MWLDARKIMVKGSLVSIGTVRPTVEGAAFCGTPVVADDGGIAVGNLTLPGR